MKVVIVGLGIQGKKRQAIAGHDVVTTVDPIEPNAEYRSIDQVPLDSYDAACVCTPDETKLDILNYLLGHGKHVLVEKPLVAGDESALTNLSELARSNRVACYTAYNHRFEPHIVSLKALLDAGTLGSVYLVRGFYGNGTARDVRNSSWRDHGLGVISDLGSHLLDICAFCAGRPTSDPLVWNVNRFENRSFDHALFGFTGSPTLELEMTMLSWRNSFRFDVFGERGSAHIDCLCKWGPSTLTVRHRVLPSGRPPEESQTLIQPDPTWKAEYEHFVGLCRTASTNIDNDIWINAIMTRLSESVDEIPVSLSDTHTSKSAAGS